MSQFSLLMWSFKYIFGCYSEDSWCADNIFFDLCWYDSPLVVCTAPTCFKPHKNACNGNTLFNLLLKGQLLPPIHSWIFTFICTVLPHCLRQESKTLCKLYVGWYQSIHWVTVSPHDSNIPWRLAAHVQVLHNWRSLHVSAYLEVPATKGYDGAKWGAQ